MFRGCLGGKAYRCVCTLVVVERIGYVRVGVKKTAVNVHYVILGGVKRKTFAQGYELAFVISFETGLESGGAAYLLYVHYAACKVAVLY